MNAYIERFAQSIQKECLNHFIAFGREHFDLLISEYVEHYHRERPHQAKVNRPLIDATEPATIDGEIICRERLGGILRSYTAGAASLLAAINRLIDQTPPMPP
jgi:hypothetical protein